MGPGNRFGTREEIDMSQKRVTIREVAALAEVSISSVSRYLSDPGSINPVMAFRIKEAIKELKYVPNTFAQNLRRGQSTTVGLVVPNLEFFFAKVSHAISDYFYNQNYVTLICESDNEADKEQFFIRQLIENHVAGIIVSSSGRNPLFLQETYQTFPNMVLLDSVENLHCDVVTEDHEQNACQLIKYVLTHNRCDSLELLLGERLGMDTCLSLRGVERALRETGKTDQAVHMYYGCRREDSLSGAVAQVHDSMGGSRPTFVGFEPDFIERAVIAMNRMDPTMKKQVDLAGYAMRNTINKIGRKFPCIIRNPEEVGITAAQVLYRRITDTAEQKPCTHQICSIYQLEK